MIRSFICSLLACLTALCTGGGGDHDTDVIDTDTDVLDTDDTDLENTGDTGSANVETADTGEATGLDPVCYDYVNSCPAGTPNGLEFESVNWWEPQQVDTGLELDTGSSNRDTASDTGMSSDPMLSLYPGAPGLPIDLTANWGEQIRVLEFSTHTACLSAEIGRIRVEFLEGHELVRWVNMIYTDADTCELVRSDDYILAPITDLPQQNNWSAIFQLPVFAGGGTTVTFEAQLVDQAPFVPSAAAAGPGTAPSHVVRAMVHLYDPELTFTWSDGSSPLPGERPLNVGILGPRIAVE